MFDVALSSAGGTIALVTSFDEKYPPENIIDGYVLQDCYSLACTFLRKAKLPF